MNKSVDEKRLVLKKSGEFSLENQMQDSVPDGYVRMTVEACGVCRTDAKMWKEGHHDLVFPRVMGHELAGYVNGMEGLFTVWPGSSCGTCEFCLQSKENLCEDMEILGFHSDGGFASSVVVPEKYLVPVPKGIDAVMATCAEPVGCIVHALNKCTSVSGKRIIIFGGGTLGLLTALAVKQKGGLPFVIEKNQTKIERGSIFCRQAEIPCCKQTNTGDFDIAVNACADPAAFSTAITKIKKGGIFLYFSGLTRNEKLFSTVLNLIHYKELEVCGSYGLQQKDMIDALELINKSKKFMELLIEQTISFDKLEQIMPLVYSGEVFRYVSVPQVSTFRDVSKYNSDKVDLNKTVLKKASTSLSWIDEIVPVDRALEAMACQKIDGKTKPLGALGILEEIALSMSMIQNTLDPAASSKGSIVFAGDHGITCEGISAFPPDVTPQMVDNFLKGGAAINAFCNAGNINLSVVDMGVDYDFLPGTDLIDMKVRKGTGNFAAGNAMTESEALTALNNGAEAFMMMHKMHNLHIVGLGEMGIGNTTSSSAIIAAVTGMSAADVAGRGTGIDDTGLKHKIEVIEKALALHKPDGNDALDLLVKIGGFEIAGIAGAALAAAKHRVAVVFDGLISTAAALIAYRLNPAIMDYSFSGHKSVEIGHRAALEFLGLKPLIDYGMRLGEGTGAALSMHTIDCACTFMREMASFDEAGVSDKLI